MGVLLFLQSILSLFFPPHQMINNIWQQSYQTKLRLSYTEWKEISFYIQEWKQFELKLIRSNYIKDQTKLFFNTSMKTKGSNNPTKMQREIIKKRCNCSKIKYLNVWWSKSHNLWKHLSAVVFKSVTKGWINKTWVPLK